MPSAMPSAAPSVDGKASNSETSPLAIGLVIAPRTLRSLIEASPVPANQIAIVSAVRCSGLNATSIGRKIKMLYKLKKSWTVAA